ncbi:hypothetical protein [Leekyejoonella antrihumi]|uniref:Uncharacterized protein n=1 Tax=Leekyejoonella antrihumi TaxID=1660198 RepID=A0A563DPQ3_9MICO|nr:hypothetical protein [Leekyejoonella antrihumi]TWP32197.1 hypothetical protein FGL98_24535 [Leekyejoonella antrihumi]
MWSKVTAAVVALLVAGALSGAGGSAYAASMVKPAYPCTADTWRAGTKALNVTVATGERATIITPSPGDVYNYGSGRPTAGDIYMWYTDSSAFVQVGWYLGSASGLPTATQPRAFWGENTPGGEALHAGSTLSWDTVYSFQITNPLNGTNVFNIWFEGSIIAHTGYGHTLNAPGFNGEVDYQCTRMHALAAHGTEPLSTLQYRYGSWYYFDGSRYADPGFYSEIFGESATNLSYGGG